MQSWGKRALEAENRELKDGAGAMTAMDQRRAPSSLYHMESRLESEQGLETESDSWAWGNGTPDAENSWWGFPKRNVSWPIHINGLCHESHPDCVNVMGNNVVNLAIRNYLGRESQ